MSLEMRDVVPLLLNVSHYVTDLVYVLYYLDNMQMEGGNTATLAAKRTDLLHRVVQFRDALRERLPPAEEQDGDTVSARRNVLAMCRILLLDDQLQQSVRDTNVLCLQLLSQNEERGGSSSSNGRLAQQLQNCQLGLFNLVQFIENCTHHQEQEQEQEPTIASPAVGTALREDLSASWQVQTDLLNCLVFDLIAKCPAIRTRYAASVRCTTAEQQTPEQFAAFLHWLKQEEVLAGVPQL
ncbi:Cal4p KNAG_0M01380 [Huiozyma naganishii CBS 8797]|uniref:Uncharacterized protein n=1 Tax=Huiozyma naganishii (strain ATCC MYA-139 / BCRC 22969 / CBS 8797 / KCTC 17520 / NBRC 10181 / NCYC 3082 / Yp74L-3) TaxID=1071383 RepID=J7SBF0_HUIN7|nr:hypothetical protein KNAG_0M01380 [Kazachstania naganishii CBS 8797]CCK72991.1 hypothetical protein KNAG_0M01380 [Kazachstania naganishii CBS 8797]